MKIGLANLSTSWGVESRRLVMGLWSVAPWPSGWAWVSEWPSVDSNGAGLRVTPSSLPFVYLLTWVEWDSVTSSQVILSLDQYKLDLSKLVRPSKILESSLSGVGETLIIKAFCSGLSFRCFKLPERTRDTLNFFWKKSEPKQILRWPTSFISPKVLYQSEPKLDYASLTKDWFQSPANFKFPATW